MAAVKRQMYPDKKNKVHPLLIRDRQNLTQIFPEEIWSSIFKSYSSSVNLHNVAQASKYFEGLLHPLRTQSLFPIVWQIIAVKFITHNRWQHSDWFVTLLTLRTSCKTYGRAVGSFFEQSRTNRFVQMATDWNQEHHEYWIENSLQISSVGVSQTKAKLEKFLKTFERTHSSPGGRSPFVDQTVSIYSYGNDATGPHSGFPICMKILSNYGKFVKHCSIEYGNLDVTCQFVTLMPNLETLSISFTGDRREKRNASTDLSLPILPGLKNLRVVQVSRRIVKQVVKNCVNLSTFVYFDSDKNFDVTKLLTNPLQHLRISVNLNGYSILKTESYVWPLTDLDLTIQKNCCVQWPEFFELLNEKWSETLKRLKIVLPTDASNALNEIKWSYLPLLKLENLTDLTLNISTFHALDFIFPVRHHLEYLTFRFETDWYSRENLCAYGYVEFTQSRKILCHVERDRMIGSNVWTLFPKLKQIDHTRAGVRVKFFRSSKETNLENVRGVYSNLN